MGNENYRPLIDEMVWSFSRIECFEDCPYRFFLKYIHKSKDEPRFYAAYGRFMHELIEQYYCGELSKEDMLFAYLTRFKAEVIGERPPESVVQKYIAGGIEYLQNFSPFPFNMIGVEEKINFTIDGIPFVGFIDYVGEKDGEYYIIDNKSRDLKPRSNRTKPTAKDAELDKMLKQLYIYSAAVEQEYGKFPKYLCFNCFRTGTFIYEPFIKEKYDEALRWAKQTIKDIRSADDFYPNCEYFSCRYICGVSDDCCYNESAIAERKRQK